MSNPQKIMMNVWNPTWDNWVGELDPANLPGFAFYDWVAYYSYEPGGGSYGTDNNFKFEWQDDFDSFDSTRWEKASHTWTGNNCDLAPENAVLLDGKLILCLTDNFTTGFVDLNPPGLEYVNGLRDGRVRVKFTEFITKESAEVLGNYLISGVDIISAELLADNKTVELQCSNLDINLSYNLIVLGGITDLYGNVSSARVKIIYMPSYNALPLKINLGGGDFNEFIGEQEKAPDNFHGYKDGSALSFSDKEINNTDLDEIYLTSRRDLVKYLVNVPAGTYRVTLMMSENSYDNVGDRVFDVFINGTQVLDNLDIFKEAGLYSALDFVFDNIIVENELIEISFNAEVANPTICGLIIEQTSPTGLKEFGELVPQYRLEQNYPNPFNGYTNFDFVLSESDQVEFLIYDSLGREVYSSSLGMKPAGNNSFHWNTRSNGGEIVNSGIYFYQLKGSSLSSIKKMVHLK